MRKQGSDPKPLKINETFSDLAGSSKWRKQQGLAVSFPLLCHFKVRGGCDKTLSQKFLILIFILSMIAYIIIYNIYGCLILRGRQLHLKQAEQAHCLSGITFFFRQRTIYWLSKSNAESCMSLILFKEIFSFFFFFPKFSVEVLSMSTEAFVLCKLSCHLFKFVMYICFIRQTVRDLSVNTMFISTEGNLPGLWKLCHKANLSNSTETYIFSSIEVRWTPWTKSFPFLLQVPEQWFRLARDFSSFSVPWITRYKAHVLLDSYQGWGCDTGFCWLIISAVYNKIRFCFAIWNNSVETSVVFQ